MPPTDASKGALLRRTKSQLAEDLLELRRRVDSAERERRDRELTQKSSLLQSILDNTDEGISLVDRDLRVIAFNRRFLDLLGFPPGRFRPGDPFETFIRYNAERGEYGAGDTEALVRKRVDLARRFEPHRFERTRPDGSVIEVRGIPTPGGGFVTTYTDVTERRRTEEALRESEARAAQAQRQLVDAMESLSESFSLYDSEDRLVLYNSALSELDADYADLIVPGARFEDMLRAAVERDVFPDAGGREEEWIAERLRAHRAPGGTLEQRLRNGRWLLISERRTRDGATVVIRTDISDLKRREQELQSAKEEADLANQTKSQFLANMSHELRTPLNAIIGFSELITSELYGPVGSERYIEYAQVIRESGLHLLQMIDDILALAKAEAGRQTLREVSVDLAQATEACLRLVYDRAHEGAIELSRRFPDDLPPLIADERMIKQIVLNLVANAVKFTPAGGEVRLEAGVEKSGALWLAVIDSGIGIAPEDMEKALAPFGQVESSSDRHYEGTGLGLSLSKTLAELHGGSLELASEPGVGTTVTVRFPPERVGVRTGADSA